MTKLSISLAEDDLAFVDSYAEAHGLASRSAALTAAIVALRHEGLSQDYAAAFAEGSDDSAAWDGAVADGLDS
jgi:hypothetical protein